jgi:hypothetical protein
MYGTKKEGWPEDHPSILPLFSVGSNRSNSVELIDVDLTEELRTNNLLSVTSH